LAIDVERNRLFVGNWGNHSAFTKDGKGGFNPPSITVYPLDAEGNTAPMRVIQGPKTQLNWFGGMQVDPQTGDLWVANDIGQSVLVFKGTDNGDVAPTKVIKGNRTGLSHPAGVSIDAVNREIWVVNLGNSSATAYSLTASGNAAPVRTIRSAPLGHQSLKFGKPQAIAYDSAREELLVAN
jgi:DNA-binding beta-propeller fold protein YncE